MAGQHRADRAPLRVRFADWIDHVTDRGIRNQVGSDVLPRRVLVTGSPSYGHPDTVENALDEELARYPGMTVIHGGSPTGADQAAAQWAADVQDWAPVRVDTDPDGADMVLAFLQPGHINKDTLDTIRRARTAGTPVRVYVGTRSQGAAT